MKSPHFYCENCGRQVPSKAKVCPGCGRFFSDVRCPRCGLTGRPEQFTAGCPKCGFSGAADPALDAGGGRFETYNPDLFKTPRRPGRAGFSWGPFFIAVGAAGLCLVLAMILYFLSRR